MILNYFRTTFRNLSRNKVFSVINIAGLSLGLASAMLIILFTKDEISFDKFHEKGDRIFRIVSKEYKADGSIFGSGGFTGYYHGYFFKANIPEIEAMVRYQPTYKNVLKGTEYLPTEGIAVDPDFFTVFSFPFLEGDPETALLQPDNVVLSEEAAIRYFGTTHALGKTLMMREDSAFKPFNVSGIAKNAPQNSSIRFGMVLPIKVPEKELTDKMNWFNFFLNTFVLLSPDADINVVERKMNRLYEGDAKSAMAELSKEYPDLGATEYLLQPVGDLHLGNEFGGGNGLAQTSNPGYSYILSGIALFILIIACINFINLTVARSIRRSREIGIRKVIGGTRKQLILKFLGESFLLSFIAFLLAIIWVQLSLPVFSELANKKLSISYLFDLKLVLAYLFLLMLTSLLAGFYPALVLSGFQPVKTLYNRMQLGRSGYLQKGLVIFQFVLGTILIIGTITMYRQLGFMLQKPLGYDDKNLMMVTKNFLTNDEFVRFSEALKQEAFVLNVAPRNMGSWSTNAKIDGEDNIQFKIETVNPDYVDVLGLKLVEGNNFSKDNLTDMTDAILINESFAKKAGWKNPVGQQLNFFWDNNRKAKVIGVFKDYHYESLLRPIGPQILSMHSNNDYGQILVRIQPGQTTKAVDRISQIFKEQFPIEPYEYQFKEDENREAYTMEERWKKMLLFSAVLTIFISCIGLFGLSVLNAERKTKEVGIRKVLGADVFSITKTLVKDFMFLIIIALLIGIPAALYFSYQWLENYPYRIVPGFSVVSFTVVIIASIALFTLSFQTIRAALANPVKSLRSE